MKNNNLNACIIVNKPSGMTSRDVINILCKKFNTKSIGHTGTLDPIANGVLVCLIGKYTKLNNILTNHDKEYIASFKLGILTDTLDITGNILKEESYSLDKDTLINVLNSYRGSYEQEVPIYSAIKVNGKKLYEYARNNEEVTLPKRKVTIYSLDLLDIKDNIITIKTKVSKGTYIRSLIRDISSSLGTYGKMTSLTRTMVGSFNINDSYTLEDINNDNYKLLDLNDLIDIDIIKLDEDMLFKVKNGSILNMKTNKYILFTYQDNNIALYTKYDNDKIKPLIMF